MHTSARRPASKYDEPCEPPTVRRWESKMTRYCLALIAVLATTDARLNAIELIENGSFEADGRDLGPLVTGWGDADSGINNKGFGIRDWPTFENGEFIGGNTAWDLPPGEVPLDFSGNLGPQRAGDFFGFRWGVWNGTGFGGSATQTINLTTHVGRRYEFSAWLASILGDNDHAVVGLEFFTGPNASGTSLGSLSFDGNDQQSPYVVGSLNLNGLADPSIPATQDNWTLYEAYGTIPLGAHSAAVVISSPIIEGTNNAQDAYVDLVSLQVVPEPSGLVSVAILLSLVACWAVRQRVPPLTPITGNRSQ
jgi:hypothetical protein